MPRSPIKIVKDLDQTNSAKRRAHAIPEFVKALRRDDGFQSMWEAVGGANGLASLMADLSVRDLRELSKRLGMTASARQARPQRRAALGELVTLLFESSHDGRPLNPFYQNIVPACHLDIIQRFEQPWTRLQQQCLLAGHREQNEIKFLDEISSKDIMFAQHRSLFRGNIPLTEKILTTILISKKCPPDLIDEVVMPLLKRLLKSRYDNETRNRYLRVVLEVVRTHEDKIAEKLCLTKGGLVQYIVDRWSIAGESKQQLRSYLEEAVELLPSTTKSRAMDLERIQQAVCVSAKLNYEERYELFRLLLLHMKDYQMDIESNSEQDLSRLRQFCMWPSSLFFSMNHTRSIRLFEKLDKLFPQRDFLRVEYDQPTVLRQSQGRIKHSPYGDVEVVKALLIRRSKTQHEHPGWLQHATDLVIERKMKAQQSREAVERAYWAISAVHLSVAAGDPTKDTIAWSRRLIKDSAASARLFSGDVFRTQEMEELLSAMPDGNVDSPEAALTLASSLSKRDIEISNQILIELVTTAAMATTEPGFQAKSWTWLFGLIKLTADKRISRLNVLFNSLSQCSDSDRERCQRDLMEIVWKPTIEALIQIGAALEATHGSTLVPDSYKASIRGIYFYQRLASTSLSPNLLAELTRFLIDQTRAILGSRGLRAEMGSITSAIQSLASSDQPQLACSFIRDLILDDDTKEASSSSWHRHLMSYRFLSTLRAQDVERFLRNMASAMIEKMREQNRNFDLREEAERINKDKTEEPSMETKRAEPSIKVTTVKMLAQLLQHNLFIDPSSSCEILIGLLSEARHLDIRIAVVNSLFNTMEEQGCPPNIRAKILAALEEYVVPVTSELNERRGIAESDWAAASEEGASLPIIGHDTPLLDLLIERTRLSKLEETDKLKLSRFVMSALEQSAVNNTRWLNLFMAKDNFSLDSDEQLPELPVHLVQLSKAFIELMPYIPTSVFKMVETAIFTNIEPSPGIKAINEAIKEDRELVNSAAGKHWLSQFSSDSQEHTKYKIQLVPFHVALLLHCDSKLVGDGVTKLQTLLTSSIQRMLRVGWAGQIASLARRLCDQRLKSREHWENWHKNCLPVIETIILQTKEAQARPRTKDEEPRLLPCLFILRLKTLPLPLPDGTDEEEQVFIEKLDEIIGNLAGLQNYPYHTDLERLKEDINYWPLTESFGRFALKLAAVLDYNSKTTEKPKLKDYLGWEIVGHLILKAKGPKSSTKRVRDLLDEWTRFEDEGIRTMGINLERTVHHRDWLAIK